MQAILVDFEDSFTYNLAQFLYSYRVSYDVVHWEDYSPDHDIPLVVWGPGPGVAYDYQSLLEKMKGPRTDDYFYFGICLGHHILGILNGFELYQEHPLHGQVVEVQIPHWPCFPKLIRGKHYSVQRYNSWSLRKDSLKSQGILSNDGMFLQGENFLSYQFHPESVGTSFPNIFFETALKLAYNRNNE